MLRHLHIRNFAIVPTLELDIPGGFTAITGETGAGKSILVDAIGLLLGDRSDAGWVKAGTARAELTAEFSVTHNRDALAWLDDHDLADESTCLLRRTIDANGRSRGFINGSPVTVAQLQSLGHLLLELHGQNQHLQLGSKAEQLKLLDRSGNYITDIERVNETFFEWQTQVRALETLEKDSGLSSDELSFLKYQLEELDQFSLDAEALAELQLEHDRLAAGGELLDTLSQVINLLEPASIVTDSGINAGIHQVISQLETFQELDNRIADAGQMLQEAAVNCAEALSALVSARDSVDIDPSRLEQVSLTIERLHDLARKHRIRMNDLKAVRDRLENRVAQAETAGQRRQELESKLQHCLSKYREAAKALHARRDTHARWLSGRVTELMTELGMAGGVFELDVIMEAEAPPSARGDDRVKLLISANAGIPPGPINKIASGGELSRISLAIKVAAMDEDSAVTQVFDEVDAGIGGSTASAVGRLMQRLAGGSRQALCVTHLAQVAVCANHQLLVTKAAGVESTSVDTTALDDASRVDEIARMLSGTVSRQSRAHAQELLKRS